MKFFTIETIKASIDELTKLSPNWLLTSFVLAANDVGSKDLTDISQKLGTDQFLDRYFHGSLIGLPATSSGNNVLRPRMKGMSDFKGPLKDDYMIRQRRKLWANNLSSRGYRDMRLGGYLEGNGSLAKLTVSFQGKFEQEVPASFRFEDLLVWLFAFEGFPDEINSWAELYDWLLQDHLQLTAFQPEYGGRFKLSDPPVAWPALLAQRPDNTAYLHELAPGLEASLAAGGGQMPSVEDDLPALGADDPVLAEVQRVVGDGLSFSFLFAGPPGTGKTRYARQVAKALTGGDAKRVLFLQFHPALGYDDFIEGFRPKANEDGANVQYALERRLFMQFAKTAQDNSANPHVVVIDELNRGDVARIFGEALTYLESDYRDQSFTLAFSGREAQIPRNLILLATANPFDRSVTDLDDALLRRFWVIEMQPDKALLAKHLADAGVEQGVLNRALRLFEIMNEELATGFGHTSLLKVRSMEDLTAIWTGRLRLMLHRALIADRPKFEATAASVETLLSVDEADGEAEAADEGA